jgi:hypothetical protein
VAEGKKERERDKINYLVSFKSLLKASSFWVTFFYSMRKINS